MILKGRIIKQISNAYTVNTEHGNIVCLVRGKFRNTKVSPVVGDYVKIIEEEKIIEEISPRFNYLERPNVANVDFAIIVTSLKEPLLSLNLLDKLLTIIIINKIEPIICLTKLDLLSKEEVHQIKNVFKYYKSIGLKVLTNKDRRQIKKLLKDKVGLLVGQTGAGKSTLLNNLDKSLQIEVKPISSSLNRGVHTTRHVELYKIGKGFIVDTPGFSAIDFKNVSLEELRNSFYEFKKYRCGFKDCTHTSENKCLIKQAVLSGKILKSRYDNYVKFVGEIYENNRKLYK